MTVTAHPGPGVATVTVTAARPGRAQLELARLGLDRITQACEAGTVAFRNSGPEFESNAAAGARPGEPRCRWQWEARRRRGRPGPPAGP